MVLLFCQIIQMNAMIVINKKKPIQKFNQIIEMIVNILLGILIVIAIPVIMALFITKSYAIERVILINKPKKEVFNYIKFLKNQDHYSKWVRMDPNMKKYYTGTDGTKGFIYGWDGNKSAGKGEQEIKTMVDGDRIEVEIRFEKPMQGLSYAPMVTEAISENQTKVTWGMRGKSKYPLNVMNLFMNKMIGDPIEESLVMLKSNLEG